MNYEKIKKISLIIIGIIICTLLIYQCYFVTKIGFSTEIYNGINIDCPYWFSAIIGIIFMPLFACAILNDFFDYIYDRIYYKRSKSKWTNKNIKFKII